MGALGDGGRAARPIENMFLGISGAKVAWFFFKKIPTEGDLFQRHIRLRPSPSTRRLRVWLVTTMLGRPAGIKKEKRVVLEKHHIWSVTQSNS